MSVVHFIIGSTGAGKSTFARELSAERGAVRFAIDEWVDALYAPDKPEAPNATWYIERIARATEVIWWQVMALQDVGVDSVLEIGLTQRADRERFFSRVRAAGVAVKLYVLDAPAEVRWRRVEARNREKGETFTLEVTRGMFDFVEEMWEPPSPDEMQRWDGVTIRTDEHRKDDVGSP